jgi:hypothetical protein
MQRFGDSMLLMQWKGHCLISDIPDFEYYQQSCVAWLVLISFWRHVKHALNIVQWHKDHITLMHWYIHKAGYVNVSLIHLSVAFNSQSSDCFQFTAVSIGQKELEEATDSRHHWLRAVVSGYLQVEKT